MDFWIILYIIDWFLFILVGGTVLYLGVFSIASLFSRESVLSTAKIQNRFAIIIPSHKQDKVIEQTIVSILSQDYPQRLFDVVVVSDHQSEITNMRLAQYPITLLTPDFAESTKAKSLQYAIIKLPQFKIYDIALVLDADNIVEQDFLSKVNDAFETAATKAIQLHRISRNRDTAAARMGSIFEEINTNVMKARTSGEDKELEALLLKQGYFIDYFDNILLYGEKKRTTTKMNEQHSRWTLQQIQNLIKNIKYLPGAIFRKQYDWADKLIQWMLLPRTSMVGIMMVMSIVLPFIYMTMAIKWWILSSLALFFFALATPDYLVDEMWDRTFLRSPFVTLWGIISTKIIHRKKENN